MDSLILDPRSSILVVRDYRSSFGTIARRSELSLVVRDYRSSFGTVGSPNGRRSPNG